MLINKSYRIVASTVLFVAVILLIVFSYSNYNLRVNQITGGFLDLSGMDLESTIYSLDGNWIFWPGEYVDPSKDFSASASMNSSETAMAQAVMNSSETAPAQAVMNPPASATAQAAMNPPETATAQEIKVPGSLYQLSPNEKDKIKTGTYQLKIRLDEPGTYGLKTSLVSGAYRLYCNGVLVSEVGVLGKAENEGTVERAGEMGNEGTVERAGEMGNSGAVEKAGEAGNGAAEKASAAEDTEKSVWQPKVCLLHTDERDLTITIHVSNYHCQHGGLVKSLYFGTTENVYYFQTMQTIKSAAIIGIFVGLGIYLLLLTCATSHRKTGLCLSILCVGSALLESLLDETIFFYFFKDLPLIIPMKAQFIVCTILIISVFYFYKYVYPKQKGKVLFRIVEYVNLIYLVLLICTPTYATASMMGGFCFVLLVMNLIPHLIQTIHEIRRPDSYAGVSLLSIIVLFILSCAQFYFVDTGKSLHLYVRENAFIIGILFFILCQINVLLTDVDRAYQNAKLADSMEIAYLQAQISPHFMFNTLNNVSYFMNQDVTKAQTLLLQFCDFLKVKHKFDYRKQVFYTLGEEFDFLKSYVAIENIRLQDAIKLEIHVKEKLRTLKIMPLILQPLVENAIKHGYNSKPMTIDISVTEAPEAYHFTVKDNGKGMNEIQLKNLGSAGSKGVGISNINYRLGKYCGETLHFESRLGEGTTISFAYAKEGLR